MGVDARSTAACGAITLAIAAISLGLALPTAAQQSGRTLPGTQPQQLPPGCFEQIARIIGRPDFESFINKCWLPSAEAGNLKLPPNYAGLSFAIPVQCLEYTQDVDKQWRELERCLLIAIEDKPERLPQLQKGALEVWGRSTASYNCYAYAVDPEQPTNWVGPRFNGEARQNDIPIASESELIAFFEQRGWKKIDLDLSAPAKDEERVVIYASANGFEHAALWSTRGVFAKMGELGVFRFSSLDQMIGPAFGELEVMLTRSRPTSKAK